MRTIGGTEVLHLTFEETTPLDHSGRGHVFTKYNSYARDCSYRKEGDFSGYFPSGTSSYLDTPDSDDWAFAAVPFMIKAWVYPSALPGVTMWVISRGNFGVADEAKFQIRYLSTAKFSFGVYWDGLPDGSGWTLETTDTYPINNWYHIVLIRYGSTITAYVDNVSVGSSDIGSKVVRDGADKLLIGGCVGAADEWVGYIDDLYIITGNGISLLKSGNTNALYYGEPYLYNASDDGLEIYDRDVHTDWAVALVDREGGFTCVDERNNYLYLGTVDSGVLRFPLAVVSGTNIYAPNDFTSYLSVFKQYPNITANYVKWLDINGDYMCVTTESGVDHFNFGSQEQYYRSKAILDYADKCWQTSMGKFYYTKTWTVSGTIDEYTKLLMHMDDEALSDELGHSVTKGGDAQRSCTTYVFGGYSAYLDGNDYITIPDSNEWDFEGGDFTIEWWINFSTIGANTFYHIIGQYPNDTTLWTVYLDNRNGSPYGMTLYTAEGGGNNIWIAEMTMDHWSTGEWHHVAFVRSGTNFYVFNDGVQMSSASDSDHMPNATGNLRISGRTMDGGQMFHGYIDEVRISKGIARWTEDFTPPTRAYPLNLDRDYSSLEAIYTHQCDWTDESVGYSYDTTVSGSLIPYCTTIHDFAVTENTSIYRHGHSAFANLLFIATSSGIVLIEEKPGDEENSRNKRYFAEGS